MGDRPKDPGIAAVLSLVVPGVGQIYNGEFLRGIFPAERPGLGAGEVGPRLGRARWRRERDRPKVVAGLDQVEDAAGADPEAEARARIVRRIDQDRLGGRRLGRYTQNPTAVRARGG